MDRHASGGKGISRPWFKALYSDGSEVVFQSSKDRAEFNAHQKSPLSGATLIHLDFTESPSGANVPPPPLDKAEFDKYELAILHLLCREGKYHSSVILASDLFETSKDVQESRVLEWMLVEQILQDLNEKGLVTYRLSDVEASRGMFVHLRPTWAAYKLLKLDQHEARMVGQTFHDDRHVRPRPLDNTDYRNLSRYNPAIEQSVTEDFIEHCAECDHIAKHKAQLVEMFGTDQL